MDNFDELQNSAEKETAQTVENTVEIETLEEVKQETKEKLADVSSNMQIIEENDEKQHEEETSTEQTEDKTVEEILSFSHVEGLDKVIEQLEEETSNQQKEIQLEENSEKLLNEQAEQLIDESSDKQTEEEQTDEPSEAQPEKPEKLEIQSDNLIFLTDGLDPHWNKEIMLASAVITGKFARKVPMLLQGEDFLDCNSLKAAVARHVTGIMPPITTQNFVAYIKALRKGAKQRIAYRYAGHNGTCWGMVNAKVDYSKKELIPLMKTDEEKDWKCIENTYLYDQTECTPILQTSSKKVAETIRNAFRSIVASYTNPCIPCCAGVLLGTCFWDIFQKYGQGFPTVILTGESQSGKTAFMRMFAAMYGLFGNDAFIGGHSTNIAILRMLSTRNNIPLFLNEIEKTVFEKLDSFVKTVYDRTGRAKCNGSITEVAKVRTSFAGTSNYFFPRLAPELISRVVWANMQKKEFEPNSFGFFTNDKLYALSYVIPTIVQYREQIPDMYKKMYDLLRNSNPTKDDRQINNIAIACIMWQLVNHIYDENFVDIVAMAQKYLDFYDSYCNYEQRNGDIILQEITKMIENSALEFGKDYGANRDNTRLRLSPNRFLERRNVFFNRKNDELSRAKFTAFVENDSRFNMKSENYKPYGRMISIDISENEYLQDLISQKRFLNPFLADDLGDGE